MKTISLKIPDDIFDKMEKYRKEENMNRTSYVMEAVLAYNKKLEREELGKKLMEESRRTATESKAFSKELELWENAITDGLDNL